jgi:glutamate racemase
MSSTHPIGVFDSGVGGLTVWREIVRQLPAESTLYVADQGRAPYGPRPLEQVRDYAKEITRYLLKRDAKMIVVACNTASGAALHHLRVTFPKVPFVGMEPAVKPAAEHTQTGVVGVIATPATFQGDLFNELAERFGGQVRLETQTCPGLVEAVEAGALESPETEVLLRSYLQPMLKQGIDQLVLGCTHYPFLTPLIKRIVGENVHLIDPAPAVARQVGRLLERRGLCAPKDQNAHHHFYTSGDAKHFGRMARKLVNYRGPITSITWPEPPQRSAAS